MMILKWVVISPYAEHARKLITRWLRMRKNLLLTSFVSTLASLYFVSHPMSPVLCLFVASRPLSPVSRICSLHTVHCPQPLHLCSLYPPSVPCLTALYPVSRDLVPVSHPSPNPYQHSGVSMGDRTSSNIVGKYRCLLVLLHNC